MRQLLNAPAFVALTLLVACSGADAPTSPFDSSTELGQAPSDLQLAGTAQAQGYVPGHVLARFGAGAAEADLIRAQGATLQRRLGLGIRLLSVAAGRERAVAEALSRNPLVEFAEPDFFYVVDVPCGTGDCEVPTDGLFGYRWDLHNDGTITDGQGIDLAATGVEDADMDWLEAYDAMGPLPGSAIIGIIDTGILDTHEDLAGKVVPGYDFFDMDPDPADDHGHGTHVAGIAAGQGNNGIGIPGVGWPSEVKVAAVKVCGYLFGFLHGCPSSAIADGIQWATDNGADVLNISLGGAEQSSAVQTALQYAHQNGVLPFCAAGNDAGPVSYPAAFPECAAVSSTNWSDELSSYSNFGPEIALAAPGGDFEDPDSYSFILSSYYASNTSYAWLAGTSMASPQAAGLGALLHALGVTDPDQKLARMRATANDLGDPGDDILFGAGRINVYSAVADLIGAPSNQVPTASFTVSCTDLTCDFTDTSTDGEGAVVGWSWDFGDGNTSTEQDPSHTYAAAGTYTVTFTATDDDGDSDTVTGTVSAAEPNDP
ncbi:MAG: S8 family serine peptidase, partial [Gemmatimonadota bacterium]